MQKVKINNRANYSKKLNYYFHIINSKFLSLFLPITILIVWFVIAKLQIFSSAILPNIGQVIESFVNQLTSGQLINDILTSFIRVIQGYLIAVILGVVLGVLMGINKNINSFFYLTLTSIRQIPMLAWIPLIVLWFGIGETSKIIVIVLAAFFPILINTISGINSTDPKLIEVGKMYNLSKLKLFTKIYLPSAIPSIFVGLKLGLGISWMAVVGAEIIAATSGIGYRINDARSLMQPEVVFVGMIVIAIIGLLMEQILNKISKILTPWMNKKA